MSVQRLQELRTCRYAIGDLRGVVICVTTASKGTVATSTLRETPSLGTVVNASTVYVIVIGLFEMVAALWASRGRGDLGGLGGFGAEREGATSSKRPKAMSSDSSDSSGGGLGGSTIRLSGLGIPALRTSVADVLRISFALVQSSPVFCDRLAR